MVKIHSWTFAPAPASRQADLSVVPTVSQYGAQGVVANLVAMMGRTMLAHRD